VRTLLQARRDTLTGDRASATLRARCAAPGARAAGRAARWRGRLAPLALAAGVVLVVGGASLYELTLRSTRVMAAELTADHMKCFAMNAVLGTRQAAGVVESSMATRFGWHPQLPDADRLGLQLVGARPCLYGEGRVAHIMYRHDGRPVSLFMLPRSTRPEEVLEVMGHEAAIWSSHDRTFVLIAEEPRPDVQRMAALMRASVR